MTRGGGGRDAGKDSSGIHRSVDGSHRRRSHYARAIGIPEASAAGSRDVQGLYRAFDETDASLVEINP
jgi:succinyl-CoA synthetase beta subunit